jgi:crotonobetainyl-CoA:carnitine CoA-transferase CaiB-like acyl-CoA transferase
LVEVNLLSSLLAALVNQSSAFTSGGVVAGRLGNRHPSIAPYELLRCGEGELIVAVGNDRQFASLCAVIGAPALAGDPRFSTNALRVRHQAELAAALEERLAARSASHWSAALGDARVPAGEVNDIAGAFALAARLGLDPIVAIPTPEGGEARLPRNPIRLSLTPPTYRLAPPALAEPAAQPADA